MAVGGPGPGDVDCKEGLRILLQRGGFTVYNCLELSAHGFRRMDSEQAKKLVSGPARRGRGGMGEVQYPGSGHWKCTRAKVISFQTSEITPP